MATTIATRCRAGGWLWLRRLRRSWGEGRALGFGLTPLLASLATAAPSRQGVAAFAARLGRATLSGDGPTPLGEAGWRPTSRVRDGLGPTRKGGLVKSCKARAAQPLADDPPRLCVGGGRGTAPITYKKPISNN